MNVALFHMFTTFMTFMTFMTFIRSSRPQQMVDLSVERWDKGDRR